MGIRRSPVLRCAKLLRVSTSIKIIHFCEDITRVGIFEEGNVSQVIQSDLFIPGWRSLNHVKGSLNQTKKGTKNCQEKCF